MCYFIKKGNNTEFFFSGICQSCKTMDWYLDLGTDLSKVVWKTSYCTSCKLPLFMTLMMSKRKARCYIVLYQCHHMSCQNEVEHKTPTAGFEIKNYIHQIFSFVIIYYLSHCSAFVTFLFHETMVLYLDPGTSLGKVVWMTSNCTMLEISLLHSNIVFQRKDKVLYNLAAVLMQELQELVKTQCCNVLWIPVPSFATSSWQVTFLCWYGRRFEFRIFLLFNQLTIFTNPSIRAGYDTRSIL